MPLPPPPARHHAGDVLVLGAGVAGLLSARALAGRGYRVTVVEKDGLASGQSGHSHGYLHRGYAYLRSTDRLVGQLATSAAQWESVVAGLGLDFVTTESLVGFVRDDEADHADGLWAMANLRGHRRAAASDSVGDVRISDSLLTTGFRRFVVSPEKVANFSVVAAELARRGQDGISFLHGTVTGFDTDAGRVRGVDVWLAGGARVRLSAQLYLMTLGGGFLPLATAAHGYPGPVVQRLSYMLVLRHRDLPLVSGVFPGQRTYGLFLASRRAPGDSTVWLVSNFSSFAGLDHGAASARLWLRQIASTLVRYTDVFSLPDLSWAYYPAPKAEVRGQSTLERARTFTPGWENALVGFPTKLTLAPALVEQVVAWASARCPEPAGDATLPRDIPTPPVAGEHWRRCRWHDRQALLAIRDQPGAPVPPWPVRSPRMRDRGDVPDGLRSGAGPVLRGSTR